MWTVVTSNQSDWRRPLSDIEQLGFDCQRLPVVATHHLARDVGAGGVSAASRSSCSRGVWRNSVRSSAVGAVSKKLQKSSASPI